MRLFKGCVCIMWWWRCIHCWGLSRVEQRTEGGIVRKPSETAGPLLAASANLIHHFPQVWRPLSVSCETFEQASMGSSCDSFGPYVVKLPLVTRVQGRFMCSQVRTAFEALSY